jgi:hypothetical protein
VQFSQVSPSLPHAAFALPGRQTPRASQQPPQVVASQAGVAPAHLPAVQAKPSVEQTEQVPPLAPHASSSDPSRQRPSASQQPEHVAAHDGAAPRQIPLSHANPLEPQSVQRAPLVPQALVPDPETQTSPAVQHPLQFWGPQPATPPVPEPPVPTTPPEPPVPMTLPPAPTTPPVPTNAPVPLNPPFPTTAPEPTIPPAPTLPPLDARAPVPVEPARPVPPDARAPVPVAPDEPPSPDVPFGDT